MAVPDLDAARRAADEIIDAGVGTVLLFGSLARGDASELSDIDLVAIYDDLGDYSDRAKRRCALEEKARAATGCPVDVMVTDAPEWRVRTTEVPCSAEAQIADYAVQLAGAVGHSGIDWDKEIGLPASPEAELESRFVDMSNAVIRLERSLRPDPTELAAAQDGDEDEVRHREGVRFATAMADVLAIVESAAKVTHIVHLGTAPERSHKISDLLAEQPERVRETFWGRAGSEVDLDNLHVWRQGFTYVDSRPDLPGEDQLRAHCAAALSIAAVAADHCRRRVSAAELRRWDRRVQICNEVLNSPIRHTVDPARRIDR